MKSIKSILSLLLVLSLAVLSAGCAKSNDAEISEVVSETSQPEDTSYNPSAVTEITLVPLFQLNVIEDANITETFTSSYETINDFLNLQLTEFLRVIAFYYMGESVDGFWMKPAFYNAGMADGSNRHDWYYDIRYDIFDRNGSSYSLTIYLNARHEKSNYTYF